MVVSDSVTYKMVMKKFSSNVLLSLYHVPVTSLLPLLVRSLSKNIVTGRTKA